MNRFIIFGLIFQIFLNLNIFVRGSDSISCDEGYFETHVPSLRGVPQSACKTKSSKDGYLCNRNSCKGNAACETCKQLSTDSTGKKAILSKNVTPNVDCTTDYVFADKSTKLCSSGTTVKFACGGTCSGIKSCMNCVKASDPSIKAALSSSNSQN